MALLPLLLLMLLLLEAFGQEVHLSSLPDSRVLKVGVILEDGDEVREIAVRKGIKEANRVLRNSKHLFGYQLQADVRRMAPEDNFQASRLACALLQTGVIAMVGPGSAVASDQVEAVCSFFTVPHIESTWRSRAKGSHYSVNLCPHFDNFGDALIDFVREFDGWEHMAIIYKDADVLLKYENLMNSMDTPVMMRQWKQEAGTYQYVLKELRAAKVFRFFVDIPAEEVVKFLIIAQSMNMTSAYHSYIFTAWDVQRLDLSDFRIVRAANISTLSLMPVVKPRQLYNRSITVEQMRQQIFEAEAKNVGFRGLLTNMIPTRAAVLFDSMILLARGLDALARSSTIAPQRLSCSSAKQLWLLGPSLLNELRAVPPDISRKTLTGAVSFDQNARRSNLTLTAYELTASGFEELGIWHSNRGFNVTKTFVETKQDLQRDLQNKTLRVTTVPDPPFVFITQRDEDGNPLPQPAAWDGFCIEMLNMIAADVGFNYTVHAVQDGNYGAAKDVNEHGRETWNGMIGELMGHEADLAVASLTITYERERVIDFTTPYMSLGLSILFKKPEKTKPHLFSFLQPLSVHVWGYMLAAYVTVSFVLFVVARFSPYEWYNPHPCDSNPTEVENQFSLLNSLWFTIGSLMQQGSEISPKALSTRLISGIWWFFTLIMISSYTANLAAFLTVERMQSPIENADDLARQTKIKYGTLSGGSTYQFFKRSKSIETFKKMWDYMSKRPEVFVNRTEDGISRVKGGGYAFILESTMNEYYTQRNCDLMRVGGLLDSKGYGIGLPAGSPYRDMISESILKFQKLQELEKLRRKWWRQKNISEPCEDPKEKKAEPSGLGIDQVAGVYVVLIIGMFAGVLATAAEFCYKSMKRAEHDRQPITTELCEELQFAISCFGGSTRPVNHLQQRAQRANKDRGAGASRQVLRLASEVRDITDFDASTVRGYPMHPVLQQQQHLLHRNGSGSGSRNVVGSSLGRELYT